MQYHDTKKKLGSNKNPNRNSLFEFSAKILPFYRNITEKVKFDEIYISFKEIIHLSCKKYFFPHPTL